MNLSAAGKQSCLAALTTLKARFDQAILVVDGKLSPELAAAVKTALIALSDAIQKDIDAITAAAVR